MIDVILKIEKQNLVIMYYFWHNLQNQIAMREYTKKPESQSRTLDSNPKASRQAPIDMILQRYKERNIQRYAEDEELIQGKLDTAQREEIDEDELLQGKFEASSTIQREKTPTIPGEGANNTGMPANLKNGIEALSGYSMDDVRVHYNSAKPTQLKALAYAQGTDIHIAPGQEQHLPHEAWHIIQQKQGRVQPTMQLQGVNVNDNEGLEKEADVMGGKAVQMKELDSLDYEVIHIPPKTIQCVSKEKIEEAYDGWNNSGMGIDWITVTQNNLDEYQMAAIEYGIKPMLKDILGLEEISEDLNNKIEAVKGKMRVINEEEFKVRNMCNAYQEELGLAPNDIATMDITELKAKAISFLTKFGEASAENFFDNYSDQGVRIGDYIFANRSKASKDLGIHLIIHECMHSIANSKFVESLGTGSLQDEGINEFFSRLATLKLKEYLDSDEKNPYIEYLGAPGKSDAPESNGNGIYGKHMEGTNFDNLKKKAGLQDSSVENLRGLSVEELKIIGEKYFIN